MREGAGEEGRRKNNKKETILYVLVRALFISRDWLEIDCGGYKSKFSRAGQQVGNWTEPDVTMLRQNLFFLGTLNPFCWMRLTHIIEDNL